MNNKILITLIISLFSTIVPANNFISSIDTKIIAGYAIGGTAPIGLPAEIRKLNKYTLQPNFSFGVESTKHLKGAWSIGAAVLLENKGMETDATVKNYTIEITKGGETLNGVFTGNVETKVLMWMVTIPVQAVFNVNEKLSFKLGPYASLVLSKKFEGCVYDGYLRQNTPTGAKIIMGNEEGTKGDYDFSSSMRNIQYGISAGANYHIRKRWGAFVGLNWGLTGIHKSDFKTIKQTLFPIYGVIGMTYNIK